MTQVTTDKTIFNFLTEDEFASIDPTLEEIYFVEEVSPNSLPLFYYITSDHLYNDESYLRGNTFSWQAGSIYDSAYEKLVKEFNDAGLPVTEEFDGISITYYTSPNNFKIVTADMHDEIIELFTNTGNAWFYILDIENVRFKLPRKEETVDYAYFYVGDLTKSISRIEIGEITETLNDLSSDKRDNNQTIIDISATMGTVSLENSLVYGMTIEGATTFSLPEPIINKTNTIMADIYVSGTYSIDWGTESFFKTSETAVTEGYYSVMWDYSKLEGMWVCGVLPKGV